MYSNSLQHKFGKGLFALLLAFSVSLSTAPTLFVLAEGEDTTPPPATTETTPPPAESAETPPPAEEPPPAVIETGDAAASADTTNVVNTNVTDTTAPPENGGETSPPPENGESAPPTGDETLIDDGAADNATTTTENTETPPQENITVDNTNDAVVESESGVEATTGENSASENPGDAIIDTGNAVATGNIINVVNTNIIDSEGLFLLLAPFLGLSGDFDLRNYGFFNDNSDPTCLLTCGSLDNLTVNNTNNADIVNSMIIRASTGENSANGNGGDSLINAGNAYASANIINVANTNIINSEYLVLTFNNIGNWTGDLVLPGMNFFERMFARLHADNGAGASSNGNGNGNGGSALEVNNTNEAAVENNAGVEANTGSNGASSTDGSSAIVTGNASAGANVINQINSNIVGTGSFTILIRIHGNWLGKIFSKPDGVSWEETRGGLRIYSDSDANPLVSGSNENGNGNNKPHYTSLGNINNASITNNVSVLALTGENEINGTGNGTIRTGNAYASANIINIVNTTVIGKNWVLAIFNIFGDWNGNIAFGRPDLWLAAAANPTPNPANPSSEITFTYSYRNNGDTYASNTVIEERLDDRLTIQSSALPYTIDGDRIRWNLGRLNPRASGTISYTAAVGSPASLPYGETIVENESIISSYETDANTADNNESIALAINNPLPPSYGGGYLDWPLLQISKTRRGSGDITASSTVDYTINLSNRGPGSAYNVIVKDEMKDPSGKVVNSLIWNLGEVKSSEDITIDYTVRIAGNASAGTYTNTAIAIYNDSRGYTDNSGLASYSINVIAGENAGGGDGASGEDNTTSEPTVSESGTSSISSQILPPLASEETSASDALGSILSALSSPVAAEVNANPLQPLEDKIQNQVERRTDERERSPLLALLPWLGGWTAPLIAASLLALLLLLAFIRNREEE